MYCAKCGTENFDDARYCTGCGADIFAQTPAGKKTDFGDTIDFGQTLDAEAIKPGRLLANRYRIEHRLGSGGMGDVWKAHDEELDIEVAVKVLPPILARSDKAIRQLKREASIALRLSHPYICRLHNFHADGETKFLTMEYIEGQTLEDMLDADPTHTLPVDRVIEIGSNIAEALDYAHSQTPVILHRDIKPSNIMVGKDGRAKLLDLGIARQLKESMTSVTGQDTSGTLLYMSPEQFGGKTPTAASDLYSLAATFYQCLAGHAPFHQGAIGHQLLYMPPGEIEGAADHVNRALAAGLAKKAEDRPGSARELVEMLGDAAAAPSTEQVSVSPVPPEDLPPPPPPPDPEPTAGDTTASAATTTDAPPSAPPPAPSPSAAADKPAKSGSVVGPVFAILVVLALCGALGWLVADLNSDGSIIKEQLAAAGLSLGSSSPPSADSRGSASGGVDRATPEDEVVDFLEDRGMAVVVEPDEPTEPDVPDPKAGASGKGAGASSSGKSNRRIMSLGGGTPEKSDTSSSNRMPVETSPEHWLNQAEKLAPRLRDVSDRAAAYSMIAFVRASLGDEKQARSAVDQAWREISRMDRPEMRAAHLAGVAQVYVELDDQGGFHRMMTEATAALRDIARRDLQAGAAADVAASMVYGGDVGRAEQVLSQYRDMPVTMAYGYALMGWYAAKHDQEEQVRRFLTAAGQWIDYGNQSGQFGDYSAAYAVAVMAHAELGWIDSALKSVDGCANVALRACAYNAIARAQLLYEGDVNGAANSLARAAEMVADVSQVPEQLRRFYISGRALPLAQLYFKTEQFDRIGKDSRQVGRPSNDFDRVLLYTHIARGLQEMTE